MLPDRHGPTPPTGGEAGTGPRTPGGVTLAGLLIVAGALPIGASGVELNVPIELPVTDSGFVAFTFELPALATPGPGSDVAPAIGAVASVVPGAPVSTPGASSL